MKSLKPGLRETFQELHEVDVSRITEGETVLVVAIQLDDLVLLTMLGKSDMLETSQVVLVLLAKFVGKLDKQAFGFFRVELFDQFDVGVDEERPQEALNLGFVDVESIVRPSAQA